MASVQDVTETALAFARQCLDAYRDELVALVAGDPELLRLAAARVRTAQAQRPETERAAEHLAFSLLTAAFADLVRQRKPGLVAPAPSAAGT